MGVVAAVVAAAAATVAALPRRRRRNDCDGLPVVANPPPGPCAHESYASGAAVRGGRGRRRWPRLLAAACAAVPIVAAPAPSPGDVAAAAWRGPTAYPAPPDAGGCCGGCGGDGCAACAPSVGGRAHRSRGGRPASGVGRRAGDAPGATRRGGGGMTRTQRPSRHRGGGWRADGRRGRGRAPQFFSSAVARTNGGVAPPPTRPELRTVSARREKDAHRAARGRLAALSPPPRPPKDLAALHLFAALAGTTPSPRGPGSTPPPPGRPPPPPQPPPPPPDRPPPEAAPLTCSGSGAPKPARLLACS